VRRAFQLDGSEGVAVSQPAMPHFSLGFGAGAPSVWPALKVSGQITPSFASYPLFQTTSQMLAWDRERSQAGVTG
jgi:hypothetical protein